MKTLMQVIEYEPLGRREKGRLPVFYSIFILVLLGVIAVYCEWEWRHYGWHDNFDRWNVFAEARYELVGGIVAEVIFGMGLLNACYVGMWCLMSGLNAYSRKGLTAIILLSLAPIIGSGFLFFRYVDQMPFE